MDFMSDRLVSGERFRLLTLVDNFSHESLAIEVGGRLTGDDVVKVLKRVTAERGKPLSIRVDDLLSRPGDVGGSQDGFRRDAAEQHDQARFDGGDLLEEIMGRAGLDLPAGRRAILRRTAFDDARDEEVATVETGPRRRVVQELAGATDERLAFSPSFFPGASPMSIARACCEPSPGTAFVRDRHNGHFVQVRMADAKTPNRRFAARFMTLILRWANAGRFGRSSKSVRNRGQGRLGHGARDDRCQQ